MEAQLEEKNQELQRVSHACFSMSFSSSPSFVPFPLSAVTQHKGALVSKAPRLTLHVLDRNLCLSGNLNVSH